MKEKLLLFISRPVVLTFIWVTYLLSPLLSVLRHFLIERGYHFNFRIISFHEFLWYFSLFTFLSALTVIVFWFKTYLDKILPVVYRKTLIFLSVVSIIFLITTLGLLAFEQITYANFLYANLGLTVYQLQLMSYFVAVELFIYFFLLVYDFRSFDQAYLKIFKEFSGQQRYSLFLLLIGLSGLIVFSIFSFADWRGLGKGTGGSFENSVGVSYKEITVLAEHTPVNATIIHPPQGEKWPAIGNQPIIRYFLFPRTLVSGALLNNQSFAEQIGSCYFIEIDMGFSLTRWPKINEAHRAIVFDEHTEIRYKILEKVFKSDTSAVYRVFF